MRSSTVSRLAGLSLIALGSSLLASPAYAQDQSSAKDKDAGDEIVVTGSRIIRDGYNEPNPVTVATVEQLMESAPTNLPDALNKLPQMLGSSSPRNNRHVSAAIPEHGNLINLRGVGSSRTLILMDGRRVPPTTYLSAVDVNVLPQLLVERVDIVTAGASAVYGSDAVAGVVNFVVDDDFVGIKGVAQYGVTSRGDGENYRIGGAVGHRFGDRLHVMVSAEHFDSPGLVYADRPFHLREIFGVGSTGIGGAGSATNPLIIAEPIRNINLTAGGIVNSGPFAGVGFFEPGVFRTVDRGTPTGSFVLNVGGEGFSYPSDRTLIAPLKTTQAFGRISYEISDSINFYTQAMFSRTKHGYDTYSNGPGFTAVIFSGNAFLPAALQQQLTATNTASFNLSKAFVAEGPGRVRETTDFRAFRAHLDGTLGNALRWTVDYDYGRSKHTTQYHNIFETRPFLAALDAVDAGRFTTGTPNGNIVCRVSLTNPGLYPGCVPFNPFGNGASSQAARDYVGSADPRWVATFTQHDIAANLSGDLFDTWAGTIAFSVGAEYRKQTLSLESEGDPAIARPVTGLRGNNVTPASPRFIAGANTGVADGEGDVKEVYGEISIPLARDTPFLKSLDVSGAFRYTDYSTSGSVSTWKLGATWSPVEGVLFRGTYSRDIRAPTLYDLFAGKQLAILQVRDPHTGVTPPAGIQIERGGNPDLTPEIGKTLTFGVVTRPAFLPGFAMSLDYYRLRITDAITLLPTAQILSICELSGGTSPVCDLITRPLPFSDTSPANTYTALRETLVNAAFLNTSGFDLDASYRTELGGGQLSARLFMNYTMKFDRQNTDVSPVIKYAGRAGISPITRDQRTEGIPKIRGSLTLAYEKGPFRMSIQETMIGKVKYGDATQIWVEGTGPIKPVFYTDVTTSLRLPGTKNAELFMTINNLFDRDPPLVVKGLLVPGLETNTLANLYDIEGRRFTFGARIGL